MGIPAVRTLLALVASVFGFAAMLLGLVGDGAWSLATLAIAIGLLNTAAILRREDEAKMSVACGPEN